MQNILNTYTLFFTIVSAFVCAVYLVYIFRKKELLNIIPLLAGVITVFLIFNHIAAVGSPNYYNMLALDICMVLIATIIAIFYISKPYIFLTLVILLAIGVLLYLSSYPGSAAFAGIFAIGTIYGLLYREFVLNPKRDEKDSRKKRTREINRDIIQIIFGIVLVSVLYYFTYTTAIEIIFGLIILGYIVNNMLANFIVKPTYRSVMDLERKNVTYGLGASYLAASAALMLGFTNTAGLMLFGIIAVFFGDSAATIIGLSFRNATSLPYNRQKTIIGTLAFFLVTAVLGYFVIGIYALPFAAILAFVESLKISLDDNIRSGILVVILGALAGL